MAYIRARKRADGSCGYTAHIRIHEKRVLIYEESNTFSRKSAAEKWAKAREVALEDPAVLAQALAGRSEGTPLASLIKWYRETFRSVGKWGRNKEESLKRLERSAIGKVNALALTTARMVAFIQARRAEGAGPSTAGADLTWIGVVLRAAKSVDQIPVAHRLWMKPASSAGS
jgi:hypothetical protein